MAGAITVTVALSITSKVEAPANVEGKDDGDEMVCTRGAMGRGPRALPHKIAEPSSSHSNGVAPPRRDSCKQRRVNLKMQIPPRDSAPHYMGMDVAASKRG